jgi:nucleoside-diphosphate-sugar epimerase
LKKVLITGASGFIAPHLIEACNKRGWKVVGIDNKDYKESIGKLDFEFRKMDVRDLKVEDLKDVDYVFHYAWITYIPYTIEHPEETTRDNVDMTIYLLDLCVKAKIKKFMFATTASLYGENPTPWREDMQPMPIEPYSWQKLAGETACYMYSRCYGLPTVSLKLFQVFGENQRHDTSMAHFFRLREAGKPITLTETAPTSKIRTGQRDFIYVKEIAEAFCLAAESAKTGKGEVINIAMGAATPMGDIAQAIGGEVIFIPQRKFEVERHEADVSKAKDLLGFKAKVDVIDWLKKHVKTLKIPAGKS